MRSLLEAPLPFPSANPLRSRAIRHETRKWFCGLGLGPFPPHELIPIFWYLGHNPVGNTPQKIKALNGMADLLLIAR